MNKVAKTGLAGMLSLFMTSNLYSGISGIVEEAVGNFKSYGKGGTLDGVDVYENGKKKETFCKDFLDGEILQMEYNDEGYCLKDESNFPEVKDKFNFYEQNFWIGLT